MPPPPRWRWRGWWPLTPAARLARWPPCCARSWSIRPATIRHVQNLRVGAQQLHLGRAWPFTATELSRAAALFELAAQLALRSPARFPRDEKILMLPDGSEVRLRAAGPSDAPLVAALHARCSPQTRRSRFLSPTPRLTHQQLSGLLGGDDGAGQVVLALTTDGGSVVGLTNLDRETTSSACVAVLVEDAWQGRGLGTALLRRAAELAAEQGVKELTGVAHPDDVGITKLFRRVGLRPSAEMVDGAVRLRAALPVPATALS